MSASRPSPVRTACSTQRRLMTGSMPGKAASTGETWVLGSAPKSVAAPENSLAFEITWAWTSSPITVSHSPVRPAIIVHLRRYSPAARRAEKRSAFRRNIAAADKVGGFHCARPPYTLAAQTEWMTQSPPSPPSRYEAGAVGKLRGTFQDLGDLQYRLLVEGAADDLQAERQPVAGERGRHRDRRQACQIRRHGEDVVQIHRDRVVGLLADRESRRRRSRGQDAVDQLERRREVARNQGAHPLRLQVIGIIIAGRQHIGADQHAPPDLGAKPGGAGQFIHLVEAAALDPEAEAHTVVAREV